MDELSLYKHLLLIADERARLRNNGQGRIYIDPAHAVTVLGDNTYACDANGSLTCSVTDSLAALARKGYWLPSLSCAL